MLRERTKKQLNSIFDSINSQLKIVIKKIKEFPKARLEIEKLIYSHPIYQNFQDLINFHCIINYQEYEENIQKSKETAEMYKLREKELNKIKDFVQVHYNNLLLDKNINLNEENNSDNTEFIKKKRGEIRFKNCYICKVKFSDNNIHKFYHNLCKNCGDYNYSFREMNYNWKNRIAIVTGGRVKIGFHIAIKLLSYNCIVIITTRFPKDALIRFQSHPDYQKWKNNLFIYPIDFRIIESTVKFIEYIEKNFSHIDILINNAAQTIRRKTEYYKYLLSIESKQLSDENIIIKNETYQSLPTKNNNLISNESIDQTLTKYDQNNINLYKEIFPLSVIASQIKIMEEKNQPLKTIIDNNGQPYDFSTEKNSWQLEIDEISFTEFLEVQIINTWTPYYLNIKLKPLLEKSPFPDKYIVNVSSVEGIFNAFKKSTHCHTNMAKAALNMMTRTVGSYYKNKQIYMTSVDTGWISPMNDVGHIFKNKDNFEEEFKNLPLDELDGAMRVLHPIIQGIHFKQYLYGILLKDYKKTDW